MPSNMPAEPNYLLPQLGPSGPEGLRRCARNVRTRWKILLPLSVCFLFAGLAGLSFKPDRRPDLPLLQKRFELLMTWTLPEIHCDDMHLSGLRKQGKELLATYRFVVYATQGSEASPVIRARLKRRFPECGELLFQTGKACTVEERVRFIPVQQYGLVPEKVVLDHPELLSQM